MPRDISCNMEKITLRNRKNKQEKTKRPYNSGNEIMNEKIKKNKREHHMDTI